jgi:hypothetical protein
MSMSIALELQVSEIQDEKNVREDRTKVEIAINNLYEGEQEVVRLAVGVTDTAAESPPAKQ